MWIIRYLYNRIHPRSFFFYSLWYIYFVYIALHHDEEPHCYRSSPMPRHAPKTNRLFTKETSPLARSLIFPTSTGFQKSPVYKTSLKSQYQTFLSLKFRWFLDFLTFQVFREDHLACFSQFSCHSPLSQRTVWQVISLKWERNVCRRFFRVGQGTISLWTKSVVSSFWIWTKSLGALCFSLPVVVWTSSFPAAEDFKAVWGCFQSFGAALRASQFLTRLGLMYHQRFPPHLAMCFFGRALVSARLFCSVSRSLVAVSSFILF